MQFKVRITAVYEWTEDSASWPDVPPTQEAILAEVKKYCDADPDYFLQDGPERYDDPIIID